jgi:hypothetical protein
MNRHDRHQHNSNLELRPVHRQELDMYGHPLKPFWRVSGFIIAFILLGVVPEDLRAEDSEDKLGNWIGATSALRFSDK